MLQNKIINFVAHIVCQDLKNMKRTLLLSFICIMICGQSLAQILRIDGIRALSSDLSASIYSRNDYNGRACALVKVAFPKTGAEFEGNVIGKTEYKAGEYWVYLTADSKFLKMKHAEYTPLMIRFDDSTVGPVESKIVYGVRVSAGKKSQLVTFKITPSNATLTVDQKEYSTTNGIAEIMLTPEEHTYVVFAQDYNAQGSKFMVYENSTNKIIIELEQKRIANGGQSSSSGRTGIQSGRDFVETAAGLNMKMVWVEGGEFLMGGTSEQGSDAETDEQVIRRVKLSSYYIGECEITQSQWEKVMGTSVQQQRSKASYDDGLRGVGPDYPMYYLSWEDAQAFCQELSRMTGRTYCLPTEAQWEYAARGGKNNDGTKYSGSWSIDAVAWYDGNSGSSTHPVKNKRANSLGLYDMSGNVWEWCSDWYGSSYNVNDTNNPTGPSSGSSRVLRGGSWFSNAQSCRVSFRYSYSPGIRFSYSGFRVVVLP